MKRKREKTLKWDVFTVLKLNELGLCCCCFLLFRGKLLFQIAAVALQAGQLLPRVVQLLFQLLMEKNKTMDAGWIK